MTFIKTDLDNLRHPDTMRTCEHGFKEASCSVCNLDRIGAAFARSDDRDLPSSRLRFFPRDGWTADKAYSLCDVPVGEPCAYCSVPLAAGDIGILMAHMDIHGVTMRPWHHCCLMRSTVGHGYRCKRPGCPRCDGRAPCEHCGK